MDELIDELASIRETEVECTHCGETADGSITIKTDEINRNHRICNTCANVILERL